MRDISQRLHDQMFVPIVPTGSGEMKIYTYHITLYFHARLPEQSFKDKWCIFYQKVCMAVSKERK